MVTEHESFKEIRNPFTGELIMTSEEHYKNYLEQKQIDNCSEPTKDNETLTKENGQLWETVEFLLKQVELIPKEVS